MNLQTLPLLLFIATGCAERTASTFPYSVTVHGNPGMIIRVSGSPPSGSILTNESSTVIIYGDAHRRFLGNYTLITASAGGIEDQYKEFKGREWGHGYPDRPSIPTDLDFRPGSGAPPTRANSLLLSPGLEPEAVITLLGRPLKTEAKTFGQALNTPWNGTAWYYRIEGKPFKVVFRHDPMVVNHWDWSPGLP